METVVGHPEQLGHASSRELKRRFAVASAAVAIGLFLGMLAFLEVGRQIGLHQVAQHGADALKGVGVVDGVVFSLTALLLGFAFSGATSRFDHRRQLIVNEANAAGTAWQRIDTLSPESQAEIRDSFRRYLDELIAWYAEAAGAVATLRKSAGVSRAHNEVWSRSVAACLTPQGEKARMLLLPSLNEMFVAVEKECLTRRIHPPRVIYTMLIVAGMASALFGGYALANSPNRPWVYMIGVAAAIALTTFVILQLEFPRLGLVRVNDMDEALVELRATMDPSSLASRPPSGHAAA